MYPLMTIIDSKIMPRVFMYLIAVFFQCSLEEAPTVVTKSGRIIGHYLTSFEGKRYEAYQGVPYALPPIAGRRFEPPVPIPSWSGDVVAKRLRSSCWQQERIPFASGSLIEGDEDCLYLNVFVPKRNANTALPVLFWIHGGGFRFGSNNLEEEIFLMDHEVILVTIQYRLGALGFLSTEDEVVPGNMGLKDQSLALRWVHANIKYFGGDPNKITIYGNSAGAASVHYHYLSPTSAGLFQNGISFSGTAFDWWALRRNPRQKALDLGKSMNCTTDNTKEMLKCLKKCSARDIIDAQPKSGVTFGPVVETISENSFIDRTPRQIMDSGNVYDVPWITGVVSEDGLFPMAERINKLKALNDHWNKVAPLLLGYSDTIPKENHTSLAQNIRKYYFGKEPINRETFTTLVNLVSDRWFFVNAEKAATAQAKVNRSPVFFYNYSYRAADSMSFKLSNSSEYLGVCHGDDVSLFMKNEYMSPTKSSNDMLMQKQLIQILTTFASTGRPNIDVEWSRVDTSNNLHYLEINGPKSKTMKIATNWGRKNFWNSIEFNEI